MTSVSITEPAQEDAQDMMYFLRTEAAQEDFRKEVAKQIDYLEEGMRLGRKLPTAGPSAREVLLRKGAILMRYDEPKEGFVEIFQFLFSKNNH